MKTNIFKGLLLCGVAVALAGCDENTWNEDNLDGFAEPNLNASSERTYIDYTLTSNDYTRIAGMAANVARATADGVLADLQAVGSNKCFSATITPKDYMTPWLDSIANTSGSVFKSATALTTARITYNTAEATPAIVTAINNALTYTVSTDDYVKAYDPLASDAETANYAEAFSPMCPASRNIAKILNEQFPDAEDGDCVYVSYNESSTNPVWSAGGEGGGDGNDFPMTEVLGDVAIGDVVTVQGVVTAMAKNGVVVADKSGSIFIYLGTSTTPHYELGTQLIITDATVSANNNGLQFNKPGNVQALATQAVTYPEPVVYDSSTSDAWDAVKAQYQAMYNAAGNGYSDGIAISYVRVSGALTVSGNFYNVAIGSSTTTASLSNLFDDEKALLTSGESYTIDGYLISAGSSYMNVVVTAINGNPVFQSPAKAPAAASRAVANIASTTVNAVYQLVGSEWSVPSDVYVVSDADYELMNVSSLSTSKATEYLPMLLAMRFPFAAEGDVKYVVYNTHHCEQYTFDGTAWANNTMAETSQFIRLATMKWLFDPTIYVTFTTANYGVYTDPVSEAFWYGCVNWVWNNLCVGELGLDNSLLEAWDATAIVHHGYCWGKGKPTQEGYGGASAFYGNIDTRVAKTLKSNLAEDFDTFYPNMSDTEVQALAQKRFEEEVAPGSLAALYPDAAPRTDGIDQDYEISVTQYNPSTHQVVLRYRVVGPATFQLVESDWGVGAVTAD